jgi:tetratricopeptide (TPR) repeat protein
LKKALAAYDKIETMAGIDETTSFEKFRLYLELNQLKKGVTEIEKLIRKFPDESRYKVLRGDIYMEQKMPEKAFEIYNSILATDPDNPHVYVSLSEYYEKQNQSGKAMEAILQALKSDRFGANEKVQILGQYAQNLMKDSTRFGETETLFKLMVDRYPLDEQVHNYYSVFLQFQKRIPEAISEIETMLNINPKNEETWLQLIQLHYSEKNLNKWCLLPNEPRSKLQIRFNGIISEPYPNINSKNMQKLKKQLTGIKN